MAGLTMLRVVSGSSLDEAEKAAEAARMVAEKQQSPLISGLASHIRTCWDAARIARQPIDTIMLKALRQRNGEYESDQLQQIRAQGGSEVYMMLTEVKCRAAESWLRDILLDTGTAPWDLSPTPLPDLSPQQQEELQRSFAEQLVQVIQSTGAVPSPSQMSELEELVTQEYRFKVLQAAQNRADRMRVKIEDQLAQGGWPEAFNEFLTDLVTFPAAFLKGPVVRRQRTLGWDMTGGRAKVVASEALAPEFERVSPFDIYPEPGVTRLNDGYLFQVHKLSRSDLSELLGVPGYDDAAIRQVLQDGPGVASAFVVQSSESQRETSERKFNTELRPTATFDALEFWGKVSGAMLLDWGLTDAEVDDPTTEYDANVWMVGNYVIKAMLNYDPLGEKPYTKTSFIKTPGAFWGRGIPEIISDLQRVCNAAARALVNNMGVASGPQVEVNLERLPPNENLTQVFPWKIWQVNSDPLGSSAPAVRFHQPEDNATTLMAVYERFSQLADDHSGIPAYIYGDVDVKGAGRTASGLSMLMGSAGKGIRQVVMHIDNDIIRQIIHRQFVYNMRFDADESIKGDVQIIPRGALNLAMRETVNVRRVEFLNATANEIDMNIIGPDGRAAILREVAKGLQMPVDEVVPSREKLDYAKRLQAISPTSTPVSPGAPPQPASAVIDASGAPAGGAAATTVRNQATGAAS